MTRFRREVLVFRRGRAEAIAAFVALVFAMVLGVLVVVDHTWRDDRRAVLRRQLEHALELRCP